MMTHSGDSNTCGYTDTGMRGCTYQRNILNVFQNILGAETQGHALGEQRNVSWGEGCGNYAFPLKSPRKTKPHSASPTDFIQFI